MPATLPTDLVAILGALGVLGVLALWTRNFAAIGIAAVCGIVLATSSSLGAPDPAPAAPSTAAVSGPAAEGARR